MPSPTIQELGMTAQEVFDTVVTALAQQGRRAWDAGDEICRLRGDYGTKCAIGHLIPDEEYQEFMEHMDFTTIIAEIRPELLPHMRMLHELREAHDYSTDLYQLKTGLCLVAKYYELDPGKVELVTKWDS